MGRTERFNVAKIITKITDLWHILKEDRERREPAREGLTTTRLLPHWPCVRIAAHGMFTTPYVTNAVITEANWLSKKRPPYKCRLVMQNEPVYRNVIHVTKQITFFEEVICLIFSNE
jgi:hypothetical protein